MSQFHRQRLGQTRSEVVNAAVFSGIIHILIAGAVFFLNTATFPKAQAPIAYQVKLVGQPLDVSRASQGAAPPAAAPKQEKQETIPKAAEVPRRPSKPVSPKADMPALKAVKTAPKPVKAAEKPKALPKLAKTAPQPSKSPPKKTVRDEHPGQEARPASDQASHVKPATASPGASGGAATSGAQTENVSVSSTSQAFDGKFSWYRELLIERIEQNWRPPHDVKDAKVRVVFTLNRFGKILDVRLLDDQHGSGSFGFKQAALRAISSCSFPRLPEDFSKQSVEFSVDLMAKD